MLDHVNPKNSTSHGFPYWGVPPPLHQPKICLFLPAPLPININGFSKAYNCSQSPPCKTSDSPSPNTPYHYLENPVVGDSNKFLLEKSATET